MTDLTEIGLTKNESKVFEALVKHGKASSSVISKESGVSYSRIYDVLASLEHKGLVKVIPEKGKKFVPADPKALKTLIAEKKKSLEELDKEVDGLKKLYEMSEVQTVEIAQGKRNFYKLLKEMPQPKKFEHNIKYTVEYRPDWAGSESNRLKKGIDLRVLARQDKETYDNLKKWLKVHKNIREIPNQGVAVHIVDSAILIALIKSNTMLLIRDTSFIKLMKELFDVYYKQAKPIAIA